jgi:hypothetical protein
MKCASNCMHEYVHMCVYIYVCAKDMYVCSFRVVKKTSLREVLVVS